MMPKTTIEMLNEKDPGIDWRLWAKELRVQLGALLAETVLTEERRRSMPPEMADLVQGVIELEAEAAALCSD